MSLEKLHHHSLRRKPHCLAGVVGQQAQPPGRTTGLHHSGVAEYLMQAKRVGERHQHSGLAEETGPVVIP